MEIVRKRLKLLNVSILNTKDLKKQVKLLSKINFYSVKCYNSFAIYSLKPTEVMFVKTIYLCFTILELSKLMIYGDYYGILQTFVDPKLA